MPNMPISIFSTSMTRGETAQYETVIDAVSCSKLKCPQMKCANCSKRPPSGRFQPCLSADLAVSTSEDEDDKALGQTVKGTTNGDVNVNAVRDFGVRPSANATTKLSGERFNVLKALQNSAPMNGLVFMLAFMTGVADVAMVLKYGNFATMVCLSGGCCIWALRLVSNANLSTPRKIS